MIFHGCVPFMNQALVFMTFICLGIHQEIYSHPKKIAVPDSKDHWALFVLKEACGSLIGCPQWSALQWPTSTTPSILTSLMSYITTHITDTSPCDIPMTSYSSRQELTCMHTNIWVEILCSEHVCLHVKAQSTSMESEIVTLDVHHDIYFSSMPWQGLPQLPFRPWLTCSNPCQAVHL